MTILVTGATGTIGREVLGALDDDNTEVRALTRSPQTAKFAARVQPVGGSLDDLNSVRAALRGVDTLFLLLPNVADELTHAMLALDAARDAGVKGIVYLSVFRAEDHADVPHFIGKDTVERMISAIDLPATVLRPSYFMQNDKRQKEALLGGGVFAMPIGEKGISMIDARDVGLAAARELRRRDGEAVPLPRSTIPLVGPDALTGNAVARLWSAALGRKIAYAHSDPSALEPRLAAAVPAWYARDLALMLRRYQDDGAVATEAELAATAAVLGQAPRSYRAFATETAAAWQAE